MSESVAATVLARLAGVCSPAGKSSESSADLQAKLSPLSLHALNPDSLGLRSFLNKEATIAPMARCPSRSDEDRMYSVP